MLARMACVGALLVSGWALTVPAWAHAGVRAEQIDMLNAVNAVRADHGLRPLRGATRLHRSAHGYARWMLRHDYIGHLPRIRASGFRRLGENLAWHTGRRARIRRTVRGWLASPVHRSVMLSRSYGRLGAGMARGRLGRRAVTTWVLHFGAGAR